MKQITLIVQSSQEGDIQDRQSRKQKLQDVQYKSNEARSHIEKVSRIDSICLDK